jgi:hypothetical protein
MNLTMNPNYRNTMTAASDQNEVLTADAQESRLQIAARTDESYAGNATTWPRREVVYTLIGLMATFAAFLMLSRDVQSVLIERLRAGYLKPVAEQICFILIVYFIIYGNLVYHFSRLGHWRRQSRHCAASRDEIEAIYDRDRAPSLAVLVPSYKEEERVVRQTLLSAALIEYPTRRVVLLIDDPPNPKSPEDAEQLERTRRLPGKIESMLRGPAQVPRGDASVRGAPARRSYRSRA